MSYRTSLLGGEELIKPRWPEIRSLHGIQRGASQQIGEHLVVQAGPEVSRQLQGIQRPPLCRVDTSHAAERENILGHYEKCSRKCAMALIGRGNHCAPAPLPPARKK
jgi:hypothetical protein